MKHRLPPFLLADGAMGTELMRRGALETACLEALSVSRPELVASVHAAYRNAGAELLTTNTFGANEFRLARHGLAGQIEEINRAAVRLARIEAHGHLVAGSIGPSGDVQHSLGTHALRDAFRRQATILDEEGVGLFLLETFGDLNELLCAVAGVRSVSDRPIVGLVTFLPDLHTPAGQTAEEVASTLAEREIDGMGINCVLDNEVLSPIIEVFWRASPLPLMAFPNAGQPSRSGCSLRYPLTPRAFAGLACRLAPLLTMFGGCCGTTPRHIAAASELLKEYGVAPAPRPREQHGAGLHRSPPAAGLGSGS